MRQIVYSILLILFVSLAACTNHKIIDTRSDDEFIDYISVDDPRASIFRIDSLVNVGDYSKHKTALLYYEKGRILGTLERDVEAVGSLTKALPLFENEGDTLFFAKTNMLLGDSYAFLSKNELATKHTNQALVSYQKIGNKVGEAKVLNSLGHLAFLKEDFETAISYVKEAATIQEEVNNLESLSASYNNIGYILEQVEDYDGAKEYYEKALKLNKENNRLNSNPQHNLGYVYFIENDFEKSKKYYLEALEIEKKTGVHALQKEIYDALLEVSIKDQSFENSSLYIAKRDSLNTLISKFENEEKIKLIESQYQLITKETELRQEKNNNTKNKIIFAILIGLVTLLGFVFYQRNRNSKLTLEREKLMLEQKMLQAQMNPHFVFNALTAIQNTIFDNDPLIASTYLNRFAKLIRQNFEFTSKKQISLEEDLDALKNYIKTQQLRFENKFDFEINIQDDIDPTFVFIPPMLLQPFVENAIEHGLKAKKDKGILKINITEKQKMICFEIIDNGVGLKTKNDNDELDKREHAIDIFLKRLKLRKLGEEKLFSIRPIANDEGTRVAFSLNLTK